MIRTGTKEYYAAEAKRYEAVLARKDNTPKAVEYHEMRLKVQQACIAALDAGKHEDDVWVMNLDNRTE